MDFGLQLGFKSWPHTLMRRYLTPVAFEAAAIYADFAKQNYAINTGDGLTRTTFADMFTFTRGSTATYFGADGVMRTAAVDEPRLDHDPATGEALGLLIEEGRTNRVVYSEDFSNNSWWSKVASGSGVAPVVTANQAVAPDGSFTAEKIVLDLADEPAGDNYSLVQQVTGDAVAGNKQTFSVWLRAMSGVATVAIRFVGGVAEGDVKLLCNLTTEWQRFDATATPTTTTAGMQIILRSSYSTDAYAEIYAWGAQLEEGAFPTSYIPTAGAAVTRTNDLCTRAMGAERNANEGSLVVDFKTSPLWGSQARHVVSSFGPTRNFLYSNNVPLTYYYDGTGAGGYGSLNNDTYYKTGLSFSKTLGGRSFRDGLFYEAKPDVTDMSDAVNFAIGSNYQGALSLCSHVRSLAYFSSFLDDASLQELTA